MSQEDQLYIHSQKYSTVRMMLGSGLVHPLSW